MRFILIRLPMLFVLILAGPALAVDGVLEINQTCAVQTGCFSGDTAGFPVTISASGSYRLTSNLDVVSGMDGIQINAADVTLDLNGFAVIGRTTGGLADGISSGFSNVRVHGGVVRNFTNDCVRLGDHARVENLKAFSCGNDGVRLYISGRVRFSSANSHGAVGIAIGEAGSVEDCQAQGNLANQIVVGDSSRILRCEVAHGVSGSGVVTGDGVVVSGNSIQVKNMSGATALTTGNAAVLSGNSLLAKGAGVGAEGIVTGRMSSIEANTIEGFTTGLRTNVGVVIRGNTLSGPTTGDPNSFGINSGTSGGLLIENNSIFFFTVGVRLGSNSRIAGNTLTASVIGGSIGLLNAGTVDPNAIDGNVLNNFSTNLQGSFVTFGTSLYDGSTIP